MSNLNFLEGDLTKYSDAECSLISLLKLELGMLANDWKESQHVGDRHEDVYEFKKQCLLQSESMSQNKTTKQLGFEEKMVCCTEDYRKCAQCQNVTHDNC